jgi:hypothetical protein
MTLEMQLPVRTFLDQSIVELFALHGAWIVEGDNETLRRAHFTDEEVADLNALRAIFAVNERANFQFISAEASTASLPKNAPDVFWATQLSVISDELLAVDGPTVESRQRSQLVESVIHSGIAPHHRVGLRYAILTRCDAYMTTDRTLIPQAAALTSAAQLRLHTPTTYWDQLEPWANLWR